MPKSRPFTARDRRRRDAILSAASARGLTQRDLAAFARLKPGSAADQRISRWAHGTHPLPEALVDAIEAGLAGAGPPTGNDSEQVPSEILAATRADYDAIAGDPCPDEKDELRGTAKMHRRTAIGVLVRSMLSAPSLKDRIHAAELILERSDGRAIQSVIDLTPKPPATASELVDAVQRAIDDHAARVAREAAAATEKQEAQEDNAATA